MRKVVHTLVLVAAIAGLIVATSSHNIAPAQVKPKPAVPAAVQEDVGTIEVYTDKAGKWRFRVVVDGKSIAIGTVGYAKKADTLKKIEILKATMAKGKVVDLEPDDKK